MHAPRKSSLTYAALVALPVVFWSSATACTASSTEADAADPNPNQGIIAGALTARASNAAITLRNGTEFVVGYLVLDSGMATIALFPPCGSNCAKLVQGDSVTVPYSAIGGYTPKSTEARVLWWTYRRLADGTLEPQGGVNTIRVRL